MENMEWLLDLQDDSSNERWFDAAVQIKYEYQRILRENFDSDVASLQAYLHRVAQLGALPGWPRQYWTEESFDEQAFVELIDTYPLASEILTDSDGVYRENMVCFCSELLRAKLALKTGLREKAWWHLSRASFYDGQAQGYYLRVKPAEDKRRSGKKGGISKEKNKRQAVRNACMQHLKNDCPLGWSSTSVAIAAVAPKVEKMIRKQREEVDVHELLYAWLNGDLEVQQAGGFKMPCA